MQLIDACNAAEYLRETGRIEPSEDVLVRELAGGVSNVVLLVSRNDGQPLFVLKQARPQLRVAEPWFCSVERIWREVETLEFCVRAIGENQSVPRLLFTDRSNYLYAMSACPAHETWKAKLLRGEVDATIARRCGELLGTLHAATWQQPDVAKRLGDQQFFEELRLDPYYRHVARQRPERETEMQHLMESLAAHPRCLVHGDFSPKNLLVHSAGVMLVDFEVGHYGDPAFDLGFFLSHLLLKAVRAGRKWWEFAHLTFVFWRSYEQTLSPRIGDAEFAALQKRGIVNCLGCMAARVDGKSQVDYLHHRARETIRAFTARHLPHPPHTWPELIARCWSAMFAIASRPA